MTGLASFTSPWALLALLAAPLVIRPMQAVVGRATGRGLIPALAF
jgi:1,4-dihydroxy-2-naphthoate octaprenyltransferase